MGFSRQEYWSGLPFPSPGDLPNPGIEPRSPALEADTLTSEPPGKPIPSTKTFPQTCSHPHESGVKTWMYFGVPIQCSAPVGQAHGTSGIGNLGVLVGGIMVQCGNPDSQHKRRARKVLDQAAPRPTPRRELVVSRPALGWSPSWTGTVRIQGGRGWTVLLTRGSVQ